MEEFKNKIMKAIIYSAVLLALFIGIGYMVSGAYEKAECLQWQDDSQRLPDWYATAWQVDQCKAYGIEL